MVQIGMLNMFALQRQTVEESGRSLVFNAGDFLITLCDGQHELWRLNNLYAGYQLECDGLGYEFVQSLDSNKAEEIIAYETLYQEQKTWS